ncbi:hypothetical protein PGTUg99_035457 [Puccinia graminis f. sp. tritici]|uniref:Uncharacterized protein n=1 Tax=Puccinia graminis f. sp. tritici TaxID=56615 RepID=A0A5B0RA40_PUCGR|nr:hypothetical protein PGTUg99_035457 [Puccinia graminis f. sp. tritici]
MKVGWVDPQVTRDPSGLGAGSVQLYVKKNLSDLLEYRVGFGQRLLISGRPENPTTDPLEGSVRGLASLQESGSLGPPFNRSSTGPPPSRPATSATGFAILDLERPTTLQIN